MFGRLESLDVGQTATERVNLARRPYVDLWMFWGGKWLTLAKLGDTLALARLQSSQADQHARFYSATRTQRPLLHLDGSHGVMDSFKIASPRAAAILERNGIPTSVHR
jgi:hypothetical protein